MWKDSETNVDYLDFDYLRQSVIEVISDEKLSPSSIGIYGAWGSGKSSLMKMCIDELDKQQDTLCIYFNGWLFEGYEDSKTTIINKILDEIQQKRSLTGKAKNVLKNLYKDVDKMGMAKKGLQMGLDFLLTGGFGTIAQLTIPSLLKSLNIGLDEVDTKKLRKALKVKSNTKDVRELLESYQKNFTKLLDNTSIKKLVVFVDELDRCNPDTVLHTLEAIRLFLFVPRTSFVIGADEEHIMNAVRLKFNDISDHQFELGKEYLEKLIQYPVKIPPMSPKEISTYILCLLLSNNIDKVQFSTFLALIREQRNKDYMNFEISQALINEKMPKIKEEFQFAYAFSMQISSTLAENLKGNPRHCKRFLNALMLRKFMADYKCLNIDVRVLGKLMLVEYFKASLFKKIAELQARECGKPQSIKEIESNIEAANNDLLNGDSEQWVKDWFASEPKLSEHDLRPYIFVSRESLNDKFENKYMNLSKIAQEVLQKVKSKSDALFQAGMKEAKSLSEFEKMSILQVLHNSIIKMDFAENELFIHMLEYSMIEDSLKSETVIFMHKIPAKKVNISWLPQLRVFADTMKNKSPIEGIVRDWASKNKSIVKAINATFNKED